MSDFVTPQLLARRRELMMMGGDGVPYQKVEWLSSGGVAFIKTGIVPKDTPRVVLAVLMYYSSDTDIFGFAQNSVPSFIGDLDSSSGQVQNFRFYRYYTTTARGGNSSQKAYNSLVVWDMGYQVICDGVVLSTYNKESFANNTQELCLFRGRNVSHAGNRIYYAKIYDGDTLMRDFVPVRVGSTGYMYDKVSGQLFGNAGTGDFILGNDI